MAQTKLIKDSLILINFKHDSCLNLTPTHAYEPISHAKMKNVSY